MAIRFRHCEGIRWVRDWCKYECDYGICARKFNAFGEHAVLHGFRSVVCAIDRRIETTLTPLPESVLEIESAMGSYSAPLLELSIDDRFRFILAAVESVRTNLKTGIRITIQAEFDAHVGFGSSAAVTVGVTAALVCYLTGHFPESRELFQLALNTVHQVQGCGSGADVAASVYGGTVGYTTDPSFVPIAWVHPITAVYCGYKKPTPEVIEWVENRFKNDQEQLQLFYEQIHLCAEKVESTSKEGRRNTNSNLIGSAASDGKNGS